MVIGRSEDRDNPWGPLMLRHHQGVWDPIRVPHLGRGHMTAPQGRTYDRIRPDCRCGNVLARRGPSTYGPRPAAVAHPFPQGAVRQPPGGRSQKKLHALLADALNEPAFVTIDGERRKITKRVHQLVNTNRIRRIKYSFR
jgi:hypothetical protein